MNFPTQENPPIMPKLSPIQWLIVASLQLFYGFAVFALTRDYYQRRVTQAAPTASLSKTASPHAEQASASGNIMQQFDAGSAIPESVVQKDPALLAKLGDERFHQHQYQDAIDIYRQVLAMRPDDVDTHNDLGLALYYSGQPGQALAVLKKGAEQDPGFQRIWLTLGFVQMHTAERPEARYALQEAIKLGAGNKIAQEAERLLVKLEAE